LHKLTHKITRKPTPADTSLTDASIFSKTYHIIFEQPVAKASFEKYVERLIQAIGRPLAYNGIILGHIKILGKLSEEEFVFLSLTKLEQVDIKPSVQWINGLSNEINSIILDVNVLVFGYSKTVIEEVVNASFAVFHQGSMREFYQ